MSETTTIRLNDIVRIAVEGEVDHVGQVFTMDFKYGTCKVWLKFMNGQFTPQRKSAWVPLARFFMYRPEAKGRK